MIEGKSGQDVHSKFEVLRSLTIIHHSKKSDSNLYTNHRLDFAMILDPIHELDHHRHRGDHYHDNFLERLVTKTPSHRWHIQKTEAMRQVYRITVFVICSMACAIQCASILNIYLAYPTTVFVYKERMTDLDSPGITLCNNNR